MRTVYDIDYVTLNGLPMYGVFQPTRYVEDTWVEWYADEGCTDFIDDQEAMEEADKAMGDEIMNLWYEHQMEGYDYEDY